MLLTLVLLALILFFHAIGFVFLLVTKFYRPANTLTGEDK